MWNSLLVGVGGGIGAILRYWVGLLAARPAAAVGFPLATIGVNVAGCFLIGLFATLAEVRELWRPETRLFVLVGLLGGFTTFSTFGNETLLLMREERLAAAAANVVVQVAVGVGAVWFGAWVARFVSG